MQANRYHEIRTKVHYNNLLLAVIAVGVGAATIAVVDEARGRHVELFSSRRSEGNIFLN